MAIDAYMCRSESFRSFLPPAVVMQQMQRCSQPIPCSAFNNNGTIFAYAVSPVLICALSSKSGTMQQLLLLMKRESSNMSMCLFFCTVLSCGGAAVI